MKSACAIDLGNGAVKCIRLVKSGRTVRVASFAVVPVEGEDDGRAALARLVEEQRLAGMKVALSLPASLVHLRNIDSPLTQEHALRSTIKSQIEHLVPIDIDDAVVDFARLAAPASGGGATRLLVTAAPKAVVREKIDLLRSLKLRIHCIGIDAMDNAVAARELAGAEGRALLVDLGSRTCNLALMHGAELVQVRACRLGAGGLSTGGYEGIGRYVRRVAEEINRMVKGIGSEKPDRITLTGEGATLPGIADPLSRLLDAPVTAADLSARFMPDANADARRDLDYFGATAFGAAYPLLLGLDPIMDLQREEFGRPGPLVKIRRPIAACAIALLAACLVGSVFLYRISRSAEGRIQGAQSELGALWSKLYPNVPCPADVGEYLRSDFRRLTERNSDSALPERQSAIDLLLAVVKLMPREKIGEVRRVNISQDSVQMDLQSNSFSAAQDIAQAINQDPRFSASVRDLKPIGDNTFAFQLAVAVKGGVSHG